MDYFGLKKMRWALAAALLLPAAVMPGRALAETAASKWADSDFTGVRLISAVEATGGMESVSLGLHFRLKEGWKVYWRSPGDAGFPPRVDWSGSQNIEKVTLSWPAPERFSILGFETLGYRDEVVLPVSATPSRTGESMSLAAVVDYLACNKICIPVQAELALDLPAGTPKPSAFVYLIHRYAVRVPGDGAAHGVAIERAEAFGGAKDAVLRVSVSGAIPFAKPDMYVEGPEELQFSSPRVRLSDGGRSALLEASVSGVKDQDGGLVGRSLTVTVVDGVRSAERALTVAAAPPGAVPLAATQAGTADQPSLPMILAMALLGGLILNLMPCVLPVLSIKLLGVIRHGGGERRKVRLSFIASAAGILFSFLVMAGVLIALKQVGASVGWGIQFQHPWFLIALTLLVTLFACNLWGFFEFRLPTWIYNIGEHSGHVHGLGGSFVSGVFATLLATPCSAPFLGTAVGFAMARGVVEILAVFTALGIGLALPFAAMAAAPGLATRLPRPGPWMDSLRRILGVAMAATAAWLLTVLVAQVGGVAAAVIGALMILVGAALYAGRRLGRAPTVAVIAFSALAFVTPQGLSSVALPSAADGKGELDRRWTPFNEAAIAGLVAGGKVVFVDVTADWCITCIVNKTFVLAKGQAFARLSDGSVTLMQADWTRPDENISRYLAGFGRYGIPFNVVYGPGAPDGLPLPELLTQDSVLNALDKAASAAGGASSASLR